jgi:hypothetical protein
MKTVYISFEVPDNASDRTILQHLAISIMKNGKIIAIVELGDYLKQYHANSVTIGDKTYDLQKYRRDLRRFSQPTDEGDAL